MKNYIAPEVEVYAIAAETGFAASLENGTGNGFDRNDFRDEE